MIATRARFAVLAATAAVVLAACGSSGGYGSSSNTTATTVAPTGTTAVSTSGSSSVAVATVATFGPALIDAKGMSLYLFEKDAGGKSACTGTCATAWPPAVVTGAPTAGAGLDASKLSTLTRDDGATQIVYNGHPLYTFAGDASAGQAGGQGSGGTWFLVTAAGDKIAS